MRSKLTVLLLALVMSFATSCKLDLLENPNAVSPQNADPNFLLNRIQIDYATFFNQASDPGMRLTRMINQGSSLYANAYQPQAFDGMWSTAYAGILNDVKALIPVAERSSLFVHAGIARVVRAYVLMTLVDMFGDIPLTQALNSSEFNPTNDKGADVYNAALKDLDDAIANFNARSTSTPNDVFYGGSAANWIRAANSMKLKLLLNRRLVDANGSRTAINALIQGGQLISSGDQNFRFRFGTNIANPDNRHPRFSGQYITGGGDYQSNFYMWHLINSKGLPDPRLRYYFYRQVIRNSTDVNEIRCINERPPAHYAADMVFCYPSTAGYWGRDHLDSQGIPPDGLRRTAWGVYPAGGRYDDESARTVNNQLSGAQGAGIHPIMMSSFVDFMLAESALTLGTTGTPRALLESAIRKSMNDVRTMALATAEANTINSYETRAGITYATAVDAYVARVLQLYDAATSDRDRLDIIIREYWLAAFGNGVESFNFYRRTGSPARMQPALEARPGEFLRSFFYPTVNAARNSKAAQKADVLQRVFWDTNPVNGFIN